MRKPIVVAVGACVLLAGCGLGNGLYNAPLPGGADLGDHPYTVKVQFSDALDLVPQSGVKVNNVAVGRVTKINLEKTGDHAGKIADVYVEINGGVHLPANALAAVDQTSLLGEKYVSLSAPDNPVGQLHNGDTIDSSRTTQGVEIEVVFGALSALLNDGGVGQLRDISRELSKLAQGNGLRDFLDSSARVVTQINAHHDSIVQALNNLDTLSKALQRRDTEITNVLQSFAPGIAILADQRDQLISMLNSLNQLSTVTVATLDASKQAIVGDLQNLGPILQQLAAAGTNLPRSLQVLLTYPFPDGAMSAIVGDYVNAYVRGAFVTRSATSSFGTAASPNSGAGPAVAPQITPPAGLLPPTTSAAPGLPAQLTTSPPPSSSSGTPSGSSSASQSGSPSGSPSGSGSGSGSSGSGSSSPGSPSASDPSGSSAPPSTGGTN